MYSLFGSSCAKPLLAKSLSQPVEDNEVLFERREKLR
jgi:hypothetical protein